MRDSERRNHLDRYEIHKRIRDRLRHTEGVMEVRAKPNSMRPIRVHAVLDTSEFIGEEYESEAELEVEWRPRQERDEFRIQYNEFGTEWSCGWHQDDDHEELGPVHFQVNHSEWDGGHHEAASFGDKNPMAVLEDCLEKLKSKVAELPEKVNSDGKEV